MKLLNYLLAAVALLPVSPCAAQQLWPISLEMSAGATFGGSSAPHSVNRGFSSDVLLGFRPGARAVGGFVVAVSGSGEALGTYSACDIVPGGSCIPDFPDFWILSASAGWETGNGGARFLVGPALASSSSTLVGAAQARLDLAKPIMGHLSLLASGRFAYIPKFRGDSFSLGSVGVGFRLR